MILVNIDGPNGVGKTTVINEVVKHFNVKENVNTEFVHFHRRQSPLGDLIQQVLNGEVKLDPASFQMLFSADRLDFSTKDYLNYRNKGTKILIVDRYLTSGIAHGMCDGLSPIMLRDFDKYSEQPNINIILTAPVDTLLKRLKTQKLNHGETSDIYETREKLNRITYAYQNMGNYIPYVRYVNADKDLESVVKNVISIINDVREDDFQLCSLD